VGPVIVKEFNIDIDFDNIPMDILNTSKLTDNKPLSSVTMSMTWQLYKLTMSCKSFIYRILHVTPSQRHPGATLAYRTRRRTTDIKALQPRRYKLPVYHRRIGCAPPSRIDGRSLSRAAVGRHCFCQLTDHDQLQFRLSFPFATRVVAHPQGECRDTTRGI